MDPGRIRPRSAMVRHSMGVDGGADVMRSVASTKVPPAVLRPSSPEDLDGYVMEDRVEDASDADFENEMLREEEGEEERPATIRRYFTKGIGPEGKPGVQSHFCVRIPAELPRATRPTTSEYTTRTSLPWVRLIFPLDGMSARSRLTKWQHGCFPWSRARA